MDEKVIETIEEDIGNLIPQMNISAPAIVEEKQLIEDEALLGIYNEIMEDLRKDTVQIDYFINNFADGLANGGDASTSSKEALVNLLKIKSDMPDKKAKIADLMTRIKLKQPDTYKPYLTAKQENKTTINISSSKKTLLKKIQNAALKNKEGTDE
jgi:hypothetical protein